MSVERNQGKVLQALDDRIVITCSTADQLIKSTGNVHFTSTSINGRILDRLGVELGARYLYAEPFAYLFASRGSTEADRLLSLAVKLQSGASSAGGDMVDYSTGIQPAARNFFTTGQTTDMSAFSSGAFSGQTVPGFYDLTGAKQFLRVVVTPTKDKQTTESSGDESYHVGAAIRFGAGDFLPEKANTTGVGSTSTSTG